MKKFKAKVYRDAIEKLDEVNGWACHAVWEINKKQEKRFSRLYCKDLITWTFADSVRPGAWKYSKAYTPETELGRRTREIALELAAHLEETGEMDRILKGE